ncbi:hypothetical protein ACFLU3_00125 [Chloroflexota bacterium]
MPKRGSTISPKVKKTITHEALASKEMPRKALAVKLGKLIKDMGEPVPKEETIKKIISSVRNNAKFAEDKPWSLGALQNYPLPPEALPSVLKVWKYCLADAGPVPVDENAEGVPDFLTIREAKWVARLYTLIPNDTEDLLMWANHYAIEERGNEAWDLDYDSRVIDVSLVSNIWERATITWTRNDDLQQSAPPVIGPHSPEIYFENGISDLLAKNAENHLITKVWAYCHESTEEKKSDGGLEPITSLEITDEAGWVYAHWLKYLGKGPRWHDLTVEDARNIIRRLRKWIEEHPLNSVDAHTHPVFDELISADTERLAKIPEFAPWDLLREVGYDAPRFDEKDHKEDL